MDTPYINLKEFAMKFYKQKFKKGNFWFQLNFKKISKNYRKLFGVDLFKSNRPLLNVPFIKKPAVFMIGENEQLVSSRDTFELF